ncbi:hypothetical protein GCM10017600_68430 [Streptosporangium carneum]|uniref:Protein kinase domain-containing protein n=1 Tax=Streptosporangium carneum TaxID=47481 RepID=A0A9W6I812_9ACTN|nr:hypothetical protein GCM10017600_68430 [Streptosporangium carneum]
MEIGPYRIVGRLGSGGMGVVYAGVDGAGQRAAVKLVHAAYAGDMEFRRRFAREITALSRVRGVCTARVLAADATAALPWMATEHVPGPTLEERVRAHGPMTGDELYGLAAGLAEAVVAIHAAGVVHRDLKPTNVLLSPRGPRVVDFGIAHTLNATTITRSGVVVGSPGWISPEEYHDEVIGPGVDVYGWGLLIVYAASGRPPFGTGRSQVLALRTLNEPVDVSDVPPPLRDLVERATAKDPADRPGAGTVLSGVLESWEGLRETVVSPRDDATVVITRLLEQTWTGPPVSAVEWPSPPRPPSKGPSMAWSWVVGAVAGTVVALLGFAGVVMWTGAGVPFLEAGAPESPIPVSSALTAVSTTASPSGPPQETVTPTPPATPSEEPSPSPDVEDTALDEETPTPEASATPSPTAPARRRVEFRGVGLTLPRGWELTGDDDFYCVTAPFLVGDHDTPNCRLGTLVVTLGGDMHAGPGNGTPYDSVDDWGFGRYTQDNDCLAHEGEFASPQDAWKYDRIQRPAPKLLLHDTVRIGGFRADHARWKISCKYKSLVSEVWYVPDAKITFYVSGMTAGHRPEYEKIIRSADFTEHLRDPELEDVG